MIPESAIGAALGFGARMVPEVMRYADRQLERLHEAKLQKMALDFQKGRPDMKVGASEMPGADAVESARALEGLESAIARQYRAARDEVWNLFSVLVRPSTTYALVIVYVVVKIWLMARHPQLAAGVYSADDYALLTGVLAFWFADRTIRRGRA